jgi:hypothetical protein
MMLTKIDVWCEINSEPKATPKTVAIFHFNMSASAVGNVRTPNSGNG